MHKLFLVTMLFPLVGFAQNAAPSVTITGVAIDETANTVTAAYDLSDPEGDACTVRFSASDDGGTTFLMDVAQTTGDIGPDLLPGIGYTITWDYTGVPDILFVLIKVTADDGNAPDIQSMVDQVSQADLTASLGQIAIHRHHQSAPAGLTAIRDSIWNTFSDAGLQTSTPAVTYSTYQADNVIGRLPGALDETTTYIVDAHYDAVANVPGADDNATGVVATMAIARILSQYQFKTSLRFIGFAFEEQGLVGSQRYVQNTIPAWEQIAGVLNMEMIGYYDDAPNSQTVPPGFEVLFPEATAAIAAQEYRGNFLTVVGNTASQPLIDSFLVASALYVPELRCIPLTAPGNSQVAPDLRRSDHAVFWDSGRKALMLTDGANFRNANYHMVSDAISSIDLEFLTNNTKAVLAAAAMLAGPMNAGHDTFDLNTLVGLPDQDPTFPCNAGLVRNPTKDVIGIRIGDCSGERIVAELFDLKGRMHASSIFRPNASTERFELPVQRLKPGTYIVKLRSGSGSATLKVEVE